MIVEMRNLSPLMFRLLTGLMLTAPFCLQAGQEVPLWVAELEQATPTVAKKLSVPLADTALRGKWGKWVRAYAALPVDQVRANPAASSFPGDVKPGAKRLNDFRFPVDMNLPRWQFTGLYAAPGEKLVITLSADAVEKGLGSPHRLSHRQYHERVRRGRDSHRSHGRHHSRP